MRSSAPQVTFPETEVCWTTVGHVVVAVAVVNNTIMAGHLLSVKSELTLG